MVTAQLVKELREKTGAGMMHCKKALTEVGGDFEKAVDWLRKQGLSAAAKKAGRVAAEGLVAAKVSGNKGAVVEVNAETDFVARNEQFQTMVNNIASAALEVSDVGQLKQKALPSGKNVEEEIVNNIATIGENLTLRRMHRVEVADGVVSSYVHNSIIPGLGRIAVLVALESKADKIKLEELAKQISMHVAAAKPLSLTASEIDSELVERERKIFSEQAKASGKPDNIIEKMVEGRIRKFYEEVVLLEQVFVMDNKTKIKDVLVAHGKDFGESIELKSFARFELGDGIEQEEKDFAAEVAAAAGK